MRTTQAFGDSGDRWRRWITAALALVGVGVLPQTWKKPLLIALAVIAIFAASGW
jgi:hypothetical protein